MSDALHPGRCWFAANLRGVGPCEGGLVRCHLIPRQVIRRTLHTKLWRERFAQYLPAEAKGASLREVIDRAIYDSRCWVWGCGGPTGIGGHHGMLDHSRTLRIPRDLLPREVEDFAVVFGLSHWLDREYGAAAA